MNEIEIKELYRHVDCYLLGDKKLSAIGNITGYICGSDTCRIGCKIFIHTLVIHNPELTQCLYDCAPLSFREYFDNFDITDKVKLKQLFYSYLEDQLKQDGHRRS